jgi:hypothetical protein
MKSHGGKLLTDKTKILGEKPLSATLSTTNPRKTDPGSNPGLWVERQVTNRLRQGTIFLVRRDMLMY